jgi:hypothetical protein
MTAATMIRTYHEYAAVGKRFESGQSRVRKSPLARLIEMEAIQFATNDTLCR